MKNLRTKNKDTLLKERKAEKVIKKKIKILDLNLELESKKKKVFSLLEEKEEKKIACMDKKVIL